MLKIFTDLRFFFEDNYQELGVREYARKQEISPPTASKNLHELHEQELLKKRVFRRHILFRANRQSNLFRNLQITYYAHILNDFVEEIKTQTPNPLIILFGSTTKTERTTSSDIDIAVFSQKNIRTETSTKNIQLFWFNNPKQIKNPNLKNNILNGHILTGEWTGTNANNKDS